ncbi:MAG TPA: T9SS type A sorting domain-containing protein, partial [Saprospiraceae bacterium]|nr:T9SS type A sorting domain-containing protein [Saprospiraceae bacterium]
NDAVLTPSGDLFVVGATLPSDPANKSLMGLVSNAGGGSFTWVRSYQEIGRESFARIVRSPMPENPSFPYYIVGGQFDANGGPIWDDIILINMDESGNINWKKRYPSTSDDEFARDLEVLPNGDLILAGNLGAQGVILQADNTGVLTGGLTPDGLSFSYADVAPVSGGGYYAVGGIFPSFTAHLMKYDQNLITLWDATISDLTSITNVWEEPASGKIYVTGTGVFNGLSRGVVMRFTDTGSGATLDWVRFPEDGETFYSGGRTTFLPPNQMAFTDGRISGTAGIGQLDAFLQVTDLLLTSCMTMDDGIDLTPVTLTYNAPSLPAIELITLPPAADETGTLLAWQEEIVCSDPCQADFIIIPVDNCGHYQVDNTSTGAAPLSYSWCNGSVSEDLDVILPCGPHTFCLTVTDAAGCTSSYTETITVTDNIAPIAICQPGFGVVLDANCEYLVTPAIIDGGSSDNCQIQSLSVSPAILSGCGVFPVTLTVTDWCGNTSTCMTSIQTIEDVPPVIVCPPAVTVTASHASPCSAVVNGLSWISATDNCGTPFVNYTVTGATSNFGQNDASGLTYNEGVSTVTYTATDDCGNTASCSIDVTVGCMDTCFCGTFSDMVIRFERGPGTPLMCGAPPVTLSCPPAGYSYTLTGKFECQGSGCPPNAPFQAQIEEPTGMITTISGQMANPYFGIPISNVLLQQSGVYTITLTGQCGTQTCSCVIRFIIDPPCQDICPCTQQDIQDFSQAVNQGFASVLSTHSCKACFTPIALSECETVEWYLNNTGGTPIGTSMGGNSFCYQFPGSGTYTVIMVATRKKADGTNCETFVKSQQVNITCLIWDECSASVFDNPSFGEGAVEGDLDAGGRSSGWKKMKPAQPKTEADKREGSFDGWAINLTGNLEASGILTSIEPVCIEKDSGLITVRIAVSDSGVQVAKKAPDRPCDKLEIRLFRGDNFDLDITNCNEMDCYTLASIPLSGIDTGWHELQIPYDLRRWLALDECGGSQNVLFRPAIYVSNALMSNQGGEDTWSYAQLDNFCFGGMIVAVDDPQSVPDFRIFPNPNTGNFTVELAEAAQHGLSFQVIGLAGEMLLTTKAIAGTITQNIDASHLSNGMYLLRIVSEGRVLAVKKFVKQ